MGKFVIKQAKTGPMFNLKSGNGEPILHSEIYSSMAACKNGVASVAKNAPIAEIEDQTKEDFEKLSNPKFELYVDKRGEFRFRLKARNGEIIGTSESYKAKASALNGIDSVKRNADSETVVEEA